MIKNMYMQPRPKKSPAAYAIVLLPLFIGLALNVPVIDIYRDTFIPGWQTVIIYIVTGTIGLLCILKILNKESASAGKKFFAGLFMIFCWGSIGNFIFMYANQHFVNSQTVQQKLSITEYGSWGTYHGACDAPYVYAEFNGLNKQLTFPCGTPATQYKSVTLVLSKGLFGYEVVKSKGLADEK